MNIDYILYHSMTSLQTPKQKHKFLNVNELYIPKWKLLYFTTKHKNPKLSGII